MNCPHCGAVLGSGVSVCPICRTKISAQGSARYPWEQQPAAPSVPQRPQDPRKQSSPAPQDPWKQPQPAPQPQDPWTQPQPMPQPQDPRTQPQPMPQPQGPWAQPQPAPQTQGPWTQPRPVPGPPVIPPETPGTVPKAAKKQDNTRLMIILLSIIGGLIVLAGITLALLLTGTLHLSGRAESSASAADNTAETVNIAVATMTPEPTAEPTPTPEPVHTYEIVQASVSWTEASERAEAAGGHLITINSAEEEDTAIDLAQSHGLEYIWIGGYTSANGSQIEGHWITGEDFTYSDWMAGEPSHTDMDSSYEDRIMLWKIGGEWSWNDQRDSDMSEVYGASTRAKMGYIIEFEQ